MNYKTAWALFKFSRMVLGENFTGLSLFHISIPALISLNGREMFLIRSKYLQEAGTAFTLQKSLWEALRAHPHYRLLIR